MVAIDVEPDEFTPAWKGVTNIDEFAAAPAKASTGG
jgi:hypothetical protein